MRIVILDDILSVSDCVRHNTLLWAGKFNKRASLTKEPAVFQSSTQPGGEHAIFFRQL